MQKHGCIVAADDLKVGPPLAWRETPVDVYTAFAYDTKDTRPRARAWVCAVQWGGRGKYLMLGEHKLQIGVGGHGGVSGHHRYGKKCDARNHRCEHRGYIRVKRLVHRRVRGRSMYGCRLVPNDIMVSVFFHLKHLSPVPIKWQLTNL